ncbi:hypothetical protein TA3x_002841 [Tundrisphaera sp. TA3]|uniref:hypothetical protein n=1 Tax=Tundrisphaera sp. TA3 TaxID=3435775 RepID=UPI003EBE19AE
MNPMRGSLAILALALCVPTSARAGALTAYSIKDLGPGVARLSDPVGAGATLITPDGSTTYAFPRTDHRVADDRGSKEIGAYQSPSYYSGLPKLFAYQPPPGSYSTGAYSPEFYYHNYIGPIFRNANGFVAVSDMSGLAGHSTGAGSAIGFYRMKDDGTYGRLETMIQGQPLSTPDNISTSGVIAAVLDLNNRNEALVRTANPRNGWNGYTSPRYSVVDLVTGIQTDLATLLPNKHQFDALALDDEGRILVKGWAEDELLRTTELHSYLLSPSGVASEPITTPEPATRALFAVASTSVLIRRRAKHRRA